MKIDAYCFAPSHIEFLLKHGDSEFWNSRRRLYTSGSYKHLISIYWHIVYIMHGCGVRPERRCRWKDYPLFRSRHQMHRFKAGASQNRGCESCAGSFKLSTIEGDVHVNWVDSGRPKCLDVLDKYCVTCECLHYYGMVFCLIPWKMSGTHSSQKRWTRTLESSVRDASSLAPRCSLIY